MDISIIIVSFNTLDLIRDCLYSIELNKGILKVEVIVVDNHSRDQTVSTLKKEFPEVILIENIENLGFARACNQGAKKAKGKYLLFLNSDTKLFSETLEKMRNYLENHPKVGIVGPKQFKNEKVITGSQGNQPTLWHFFLDALLLTKLHFLQKIFKFQFINPPHPAYESTHKIYYVSGSCLMISKKLFDKLEGFDEHFFFYLEDLDLCRRVWQEGLEIIFLHEASMLHYGGGSGSHRASPILSFYFQSLKWYYCKYYGKFSQTILKLILFFHIIIRVIIAWVKRLFKGDEKIYKQTIEQYRKASKAI